MKKTPEEVAAEKAAKAEAAAAAKALKEKEAADKKAKAEADKVAAKAAADAKKTADAEAKAKAAADAKAAKEASRMPEQNGVRRPKADGACGKAWAIFDELSAKTGSPATIAASLEKAKGLGMSDSTVKTQYARWRAFHGITGRLAVAEAKA